MPKKTTQNAKIVNYLKQHPEGLTALECCKLLDITKLSTRIGEIVRNGVPIKSVKESHTNTEGVTSYYNRYFLGAIE